MLTLRADYTNGSHALTREAYRSSGDVAGAIAAFDDAARAWRAALLHHGAEIALLRDLYRARQGSSIG